MQADGLARSWEEIETIGKRAASYRDCQSHGEQERHMRNVDRHKKTQHAVLEKWETLLKVNDDRDTLHFTREQARKLI